MEHHDPTQIGTDDAPSPDLGASETVRASKRLVRSGDPAPRRLAFDRLGRVLLASLLFLGLTVVGGSSVSRSVVAWLHRRPEYRVSFADIMLDPPPPPWIKGGRAALLEAIRDGREPLRSFSILDLDLNRLLTDVRRNPWVARADRASKSYPDRISVTLVYREPVALVHATNNPPQPIDHEGVALPADGLDASQAGPLVAIAAEPPPTAPKPGLIWPGGDDHRLDRPGPRARVLRAARLAGQLKAGLRSIEPGAWKPESVRIRVDEPTGGLWVEFDQTMVLWGRYANLDAPGEPTDEEKWHALVARAARDGGLPALGPGEYLDAHERMHVRTLQMTR